MDFDDFDEETDDSEALEVWLADLDEALEVWLADLDEALA